MRRRRGHSGHARLVLERIQTLYSMAVDAARRGDVEYARMLTGLIRRLSQRNRVRPPRAVKRGICKNCGAPLLPGLTARVRLRSQGRGFAYRVITCLECGWVHRYPYKPYKTRIRAGAGGGPGVQPQG